MAGRKTTEEVVVTMGHLIRIFGTESAHWKQGYISSEDTHCYINCLCGRSLNGTDYELRTCSGCGRGYITELNCYRLPAWVTRFIAKRN